MDALEGLKKIPDNSVDLILTDPPYNTGMSQKSQIGRKMGQSAKKPWLFGFFNDNYSEEDYNTLIRNFSSEFFRVLKNNHAGYIFINWKKLGLGIKGLENAGFFVKNCIVWDKIVHGLNYQNYAYTYELIIFFIKGSFFPNNKSVKNYYYKDVWNIQRKIDNSQKEGHHETEKLIKVVKIPILHGTNKGDIVLDVFMGSGTTAVACKQLGRNFIGFEINPKYVEIVNKRLFQNILK